MKGFNMIQEQTISGGRQSGKSYSAMKLAIDAAVQGERVLFDCDSRRMLLERFRQLRELSPSVEIARVTLSNGHERIDFRTGGSIIMVNRTAHGGRGVTADVHIIDHERQGAEANPTAQRVIRTNLAPVGVEC